MGKRPEVVVIGAGVVGCATAYFLAKRGVRTTLVERKSVGGCASGFAAGLLNPLNGHGIPGPIEALAQEGFRLHLELADALTDETGIDTQLRPISGIWVAFDDEESRALSELFRLSQRLDGFPARWMDDAEVRSLETRVTPTAFTAMGVEGTRQIDSFRHTQALAQAAEKHGAATMHGELEGLHRSNGKVSAVVVSGETMECEGVVLAMGPWTGMAGSLLGTRVPVGPLKGQILRLKLDGPPLEHAFYDAHGGYVAPKPDGLTWAGTTEEEVGFDDLPTPDAGRSIIRGASRIIPALEGAEWALQTACLRPVTEDGMPIIGEAPGCEGLYLATGAGRKGILLGPTMGRIIADLITSGRTDLPIESFSPARFAEG